MFILVICCAATAALTFGVRFLNGIENVLIMRALNCLLYAVFGAIAAIGIKMSRLRLKIEIKNYRQYLWAFLVFAFLTISIAVVPSLFGKSLIGGKLYPPYADTLIYSALFYIVFVGPAEELIFRGYIQELLETLLPKNKWLGAVISAALFGLWHIINGSFLQVLFTFGIGLVLGLAKYFIKDFTFISAALTHGIYDFFNVVWRIVLIV